jgi:predicted negative regulator of RcsB-dependent stress response
VLRPCAHPSVFFPAGEMSQARAEIAAGRMGDALLRCGQEKQALAAWAQGVQQDFGGAAAADAQ